jgi:hypothetical protein
MWLRFLFLAPPLLLAPLHLTRLASAQVSPHPTPPTGAPAPDPEAVVKHSLKPKEPPALEVPDDITSVSLSSGGQWSEGNTRFLAFTANGVFDYRRDANGFGVSLLANYGQSGKPDNPVQLTALNGQIRGRYDRYFLEEASFFLIATGRHDRFQGLDWRTNLDPGLKYLFLLTESSGLWGEAGYDLQYDIRRDEARFLPDQMLDKTRTDHSTRVFFGFRHSFNEAVNISTGLEYLQSLEDAGRYRMNADALFAADVGRGFAVGFGFSGRYDNFPLPGKRNFDSATNLSLIYTFSESPDEDDEEEEAKGNSWPSEVPPHLLKDGVGSREVAGHGRLKRPHSR